MRLPGAVTWRIRVVSLSKSFQGVNSVGHTVIIARESGQEKHKVHLMNVFLAVKTLPNQVGS